MIRARLRETGRLSNEVVADIAAKDPLTRKVYDSYIGFILASSPALWIWGELSETGYRDTRRLALA